jgi:hypothetical protein
MTIDDVRNALWSWFESNDSFEIERDGSKLLLLTDGEMDEKQAGIKCALADFAESGVVKKCEHKEKTYYILTKSIDMYEQSVSLNFVTARQLALTVNNFCEVIGDKTDWVDRESVQEKDVRSLIAIINILEEKLKDA